MADIQLAASVRTDFGKGAARRTRRAGQIPAVLYGHGGAPKHIALPGHETFLALKHANALFEIDIEGEKHLAIVRDVQREPVRQVIEHVDLLLVKKGEKVVVDVNVHVVGESAPATIHVVEAMTLSIAADATALPEYIEVDITDLAGGAVVYARDIKLPEGVELVTEPDADVVLISDAKVSATESGEDEGDEESAEA